MKGDKPPSFEKFIAEKLKDTPEGDEREALLSYIGKGKFYEERQLKIEEANKPNLLKKVKQIIPNLINKWMNYKK